MAKRYATYEELQQSSGGVWIPANVLGAHYANVTVRDHSIAVTGSRGGNVTLKPGDTLGYDRGEVWTVPSPTSFKDPVRRLLAKLKIPQRVIDRVGGDGVFQTSERWYDQCHCPSGRRTNEWITDGTKVVSDEIVLEKARDHFRGGGRKSIRIEKATFAIEVTEDRHMNGATYFRVTHIMVWPGYDGEKLMAAIRAAKHTR